MHWVHHPYRWKERQRTTATLCPFWETVRRVVRYQHELAPDWAEEVAWTNLYRVAPAKGGNPTDNLMKAQFKACAKLMVREMQKWTPQAAIFITESRIAKYADSWFLRFSETIGVRD